MVNEASSVMSRTVSRLCLAIDPVDGQADLQTDKLSSQGGERFVMIPPGRTEFYLDTLFVDFASLIIKVSQSVETLNFLRSSKKWSQENLYFF